MELCCNDEQQAVESEKESEDEKNVAKAESCEKRAE